MQDYYNNQVLASTEDLLSTSGWRELLADFTNFAAHPLLRVGRPARTRSSSRCRAPGVPHSARSSRATPRPLPRSLQHGNCGRESNRCWNG